MSSFVENEFRLSDRRKFLRTAGVAVPALILSNPLVATSTCVETEDNIEGPFYKPGSPERANLVEDGMPGVRLTVTGRVLSTHCDPLSDALLDVWQADDSGTYDNQGFRLRGRLYTSKSGSYRIETIVPKRYRIDGSQKYRPAHIHLKVSAPGFPLLTTQLYFPDDPYNSADSAFRESLVIRPKRDGGKKLAHFDFILKPA